MSVTCLIKIVGSINSRHGVAEQAASLEENEYTTTVGISTGRIKYKKKSKI